MAGGNLSPRQKMIGMMYLVLTALLALNVSKEIINAFVVVNESLEQTTKNFDLKNQDAYRAFEKAMQNDAKKTEPFYNKAKEVKKLSDGITKYIEDLKIELVMKTEKIEDIANLPKLKDVAKKDDYDTPTTLMCGSAQDGKGYRASEFKAELEKYKEGVLKILGPEYNAKFKARFEELLNTHDPAPAEVRDKKKTWEMVNFYHNPVVAVVALLSKMQNDVKTAESEVNDFLLRSIDAGSFKFDALQARVIAPTSYVLLGNEYQADVFLAAYSSTSNPEIIVGQVDTAKKQLIGAGRPIEVAGGMGRYTVRPTTEGIQKWGGIIKVKNPETNEEENYPFTAEFIAAKPSAVVSPDKMNVLYIGVDNPVSISVPGVANDKVLASISGGSLKKVGGNSYIATVTTQGEATISISAQLEGKSSVPMGAFKFRVKRVPDPVAMVAGKKEGTIQKSILAAQSAIIPVMENFDFELYFKVKSFKMSRYGKGRDPVEYSSDNNLIGGAMKEAINSARPGDKVYFEYIKAVGPDGSIRSLSSISFTIQ